MPQRSTVSVNQTPQYGDKTVLERASKTLTETPMSGALTPARGPGRPPQQGPQTSAPSAPGPPAGVPDEQARGMDEFARAVQVAQFWQRVVQLDPSPLARMYAADAREKVLQLSRGVRNVTPYFE